MSNFSIDELEQVLAPARSGGGKPQKIQKSPKIEYTEKDRLWLISEVKRLVDKVDDISNRPLVVKSADKAPNGSPQRYEAVRGGFSLRAGRRCMNSGIDPEDDDRLPLWVLAKFVENGRSRVSVISNKVQEALDAHPGFAMEQVLDGGGESSVRQLTGLLEKTRNELDRRLNRILPYGSDLTADFQFRVLVPDSIFPKTQRLHCRVFIPEGRLPSATFRDIPECPMGVMDISVVVDFLKHFEKISEGVCAKMELFMQPRYR